MIADPGSTAWIEQRLGKVTASRMADVVAKLKSGAPAKQRQNYQLELLAERLTGLATEHYVSREMLYGLEMEAAGVAAYEFQFDVATEPCGFIEHPRLPGSGATPDRRVIGDNGLLEIKVPKTTTFLGAFLSAVPDDAYLAQATWQMACAEAAWCDLVYFDPRMPIDLQLRHWRVERDESVIAKMETEVIQFLGELNELELKVRSWL
jgi:hypothetical protein